MSYFLLELALCGTVVVVVGTLLFLVSVSLVAVAKGSIMLARLLSKLAAEAAPALSPRAWRSTERLRTPG